MVAAYGGVAGDAAVKTSSFAGALLGHMGGAQHAPSSRTAVGIGVGVGTSVGVGVAGVGASAAGLRSTTSLPHADAGAVTIPTP